jgi:hypothetical protein
MAGSCFEAGLRRMRHPGVCGRDVEVSNLRGDGGYSRSDANSWRGHRGPVMRTRV